jgi:dTMP kinase
VSMENHKPLFIVFEGLDGSGKTTQISRVAERLFCMNKNNDVYITREPTREFSCIREEMRKGKDVRQDAEWYAEMFVRDRKKHWEEKIAPALKNGTHVLCDRYKCSTLAYQTTQGMDLQTLINMHEGIGNPDLTIVLDLPADVSFKRRNKDGDGDMFDKDFLFQESLRQNNLTLGSALLDEKIVYVNADRSIEEVTSEIMSIVSESLSV